MHDRSEPHPRVPNGYHALALGDAYCAEPIAPRGITAVYIHADFISLVVKERMEDAARYAEQRRALRLARAPRLPVRVRLGAALVRCGHWIMGRSRSAPRAPIGLQQSQS